MMEAKRHGKQESARAVCSFQPYSGRKMEVYVIDVSSIKRHLLYSEFVEARKIREQCRAEGLSYAEGFTVAYKAGLLAGKASYRERLKDAHKRLHAAQKRTEQAVEHWLDDMTASYDLLAPIDQIALIAEMRQIFDEMETSAKNRMNSLTSGDETEEQNNG